METGNSRQVMAAGSQEARWLRGIRDIAASAAATDAQAGRRIRMLLYPPHLPHGGGTAAGCPGCFPPGEAIRREIPDIPPQIREAFDEVLAGTGPPPPVSCGQEAAVAEEGEQLSGLTRKAALESLARLGYDRDARERAVLRAMIREKEIPLGGHVITCTSEGAFAITPAREEDPDPDPGQWDEMAADASRTRPGGHELIRALIARHGVDRFPTAAATYRHTADELGELGEAIMDWYQAAPAGELAQVTREARAHVRKELGDLGLCVYGLADKLDENLDEAMAGVVAGETRSFVVTDGDLGEKTARG